MSLKHSIRRLIRKTGYDITRYNTESHPIAQMRQFLHSNNIDTVLDIGANSGQFAEFIRKGLGYTNTIISFEPLSSAFSVLKAKADKDPCWDAFNIALGNSEEFSEINISSNSYSSSLLEMLPSHLKSAPNSGYLGKEKIEIKKLDSIFDDFCNKNCKVYMKIDTQGFESKVLKGAEKSLKMIHTVQMEMSLVCLYEGEMLFDELYSFMKAKGFSLVAILPGFADKETGQLLQVDGIFHRYI